jgi:hypothetical protein
MYHESWGSERLLFNVKSAIWQLYHRGENKLHSMRWWWCLICTRPTHLVGLYSANSLKQHSMGRHVISLRHFILILIQPVFDFTPYSCMCNGKAENTNLIFFGLTLQRFKLTIYYTRGNHANHYITDADQKQELHDT